jgi:serine/threonine protein kinase
LLVTKLGTQLGPKLGTKAVAQSIRSPYHLLGRVGRGQYSQVFCAIHKATGDVVALKQIDPARSVTAEFLRELRWLVTLQHPNVVAWRGYNHCQEGRYLVMDYCEGGTLRQLMARSLTLPQAVAIVIDLLEGLAHVHSRGIIHADVKPENVLLRLVPGGWQARLADFGIACAADAVRDGACGSPAYMAPERFSGALCPGADLYAIGIMLYELLVGDRPFSGTPHQLQNAHLAQGIRLPPSVPDGLQAILRQALSKDPADRFPNAAAMIAALQPWRPMPPAIAYTMPPPQSFPMQRHHLQFIPIGDATHPMTQWQLWDAADHCLAQFQTLTWWQTIVAAPAGLQAIEVGGQALAIGLRPLRIDRRSACD